MDAKEKFKSKLEEIVLKKGRNNFYLSQKKYEKILMEVKAAKFKEKYKSDLDYRRLKRYDIIGVGKKAKLIRPLKDGSTIKYFATIEETYGIIHDAHLATGHGGRNRLMKEINSKYNNITIEAITLYLSLCEACKLRTRAKKKAVAVNQMLKNELNSRCLVDLMDLQEQPDDEFRFILIYQDYLTKFIVLRPLKTAFATEVAIQLMDIFTLLGAPTILQCDIDRDFAVQIIEELGNIWDGIKIIHGKSQDEIGPINQDVQSRLSNWLVTNQTHKWADGLKFVQMMKNNTFNDELKQTPYEAFFRKRMQFGLKTFNLPVPDLKTEEELEQLISKVEKNSGNDE